MLYIDIIINEFYPLNCFDIQPNVYEINKDGIILNTLTNRIIHPSKSNDGYMVISLKTIHGTKKQYRFHRLIAYIFCDGYSTINNQVNHIDGNKLNNSPENLEWCDSSYNNKHRHIIAYKMNYKFKNPPIRRGEDSTSNIFPEKMVHLICQKLIEYNFSTKKVVSACYDENSFYSEKQLRELVNGIKYRKCWKHISKNYF